jgi:hypothetical protein
MMHGQNHFKVICILNLKQGSRRPDMMLPLWKQVSGDATRRVIRRKDICPVAPRILKKKKKN